jgi:hypothetical protein
MQMILEEQMQMPNESIFKVNSQLKSFGHPVLKQANYKLFAGQSPGTLPLYYNQENVNQIL